MTWRTFGSTTTGHLFDPQAGDLYRTRWAWTVMDPLNNVGTGECAANIQF